MRSHESDTLGMTMEGKPKFVFFNCAQQSHFLQLGAQSMASLMQKMLVHLNDMHRC